MPISAIGRSAATLRGGDGYVYTNCQILLPVSDWIAVVATPAVVAEAEPPLFVSNTARFFVRPLISTGPSGRRQAGAEVDRAGDVPGAVTSHSSVGLAGSVMSIA